MSRPPNAAPIAVEDHHLDTLLILNNTHATETSLLDRRQLAALTAMAFLAATDADLHSLLIAFDQDADYASVNFHWFRQRYSRFVYVDRIIVGAAARGTGIARRHYQRLFAEAAADGHQIVVCEVNRVPPNAASDAFHQALGFGLEGEGEPAAGKHVRYLIRRLK